MFPRHERNQRRSSKTEGDGEGDENNALSEPPTKNEDMEENEFNFSHPPEPKKSRGRPQKQHWTHEWNDKATEALIDLWSTKEELYNKQHPQFYAKESKDRAVEEIKNALNERGFNVTESNILSKFQSLRTYFCTQRTKFASAKKSNSNTRYGGMDEGESKWRFYKNLMFLDDNMKQRDSTQRKQSEYKSEYDNGFALRSMVSIEQPCFRDYDPTSEFLLRESAEMNGGMHSNNAMDSPPLASVVSDPTRLIDQSNSSSTTATTPSMSDVSLLLKTKHEDFLFGELVGNMIHQLPPGQHKDVIKLEIQQLIIKAKYASTNHSDQSINNNNNNNMINNHSLNHSL